MSKQLLSIFWSVTLGASGLEEDGVNIAEVFKQKEVYMTLVRQTFCLFVATFLICQLGCVSSNDFEAMKKKVTTLEQQVVEIQNKQSWAELTKDIDEVAYLTPGSSGYSTLKNSLGTVTVSLDNVQPYANGSRVTLRFGNLTGATINDAKVNIDYGVVDGKGFPDNEHAKTKEFVIERPLRPGSWTSVRTILEGFPSSNLGFVRVKDFSHKGIMLTKSES